MKTIPCVPSSARSLLFGLSSFCQYPVAAAGALALGAALELHAAGSAPSAYRLTEVEKPPVLKREMRIRFSRSLRKEHDQITLRFIVTADGKTSQITAVKFSDPEIIEPAFIAYQDAEYVPATKDGKPVAAWMEVTEIAN